MAVVGVNDLAARVLTGDRRACARLITLVEDRDPAGLAQLRQLPARAAFRIGVTGPPGAGKSTLVDLLIQRARAAGEAVGVLAVDPSSPYTGGAILGDRVRMQDHSADSGVFIRSMGSRGHLGGLAAATASACRILEAFGCGVVIVETVGIGQSEIEIASLADAVVLVLAPNAGDGIQALKAGIMEVPDLFVINKGDVPGAAAAGREIRAMLEEGARAHDLEAGTEAGPTRGDPTRAAGPTRSAGRPAVERIFVTRGLEALADSGVPELWAALDKLRPAGDEPARRRPHREAVLSEALEIVRERLEAAGEPEIAPGEDLRAAAERWLSRLLATALSKG